MTDETAMEMTEYGLENEKARRDLSVYVPEKVRRPGEIGFALFGITLGILGYYFAMDMTSDTHSSPSVFPKLASVVIIACGLITFTKAAKKRAPSERQATWRFLLPKDVFVMLLMLITYCIALPRLHFIPSSYLFMVAGMTYLHRGAKIIQSMAYSGIALAVLVVVFRYLFLVILP